MSVSLYPKLGIIAGGGAAPRRVIEACQAQGRECFVLCLEGQAEPDLAADLPHAWLSLGSVGKLRDLIARENIADLVMIGRVRRPSLKELHPDNLGLKVLTRIGLHLYHGDDTLLRAVGKILEHECGVRMIGVQDILGGVLVSKGKLGKYAPDAPAELDIKRGVDVSRVLGEADIGQSVVVQQGLVLGVEAIEGTDALIARCKELKRDGPGGVLIKLAKKQQDERYDLPTIGPDTIGAAAAAGLRGIAVEAGRTLLIDADLVRKLADDNGLFVVGIP